MVMKRPIGVIGLGRVGLPLALLFASAGQEVIVWDKVQNVRNQIEGETSPIDEPYVQGLIEANELTFARPETMSMQAGIVFIAVPTPALEDGSLNPVNIVNVIKSLTVAGRRAVPVVVTSTVSPGTCRNILVPLTARLGLRLVYAPLDVAPGTIVRDLGNPEIQVVGHSGDGAGHRVLTELKAIAPNAPQHLMSYESAELAVISAEVFVAFKISFANSLGRMAEQYGANVDNVLDALALHREIGGVGMRAGAGYGGPILPTDVRAFAAAGGALGTVIDRMNLAHLKWVAAKVRATKSRTFAVVGRSYKEGSNCRDESFGDLLTEELSKRMISVPVDKADVVIVTQPLRSLNLCELISDGCTVIDLWHTHPYLEFCDVTYLPFGA